MADSLPPLSPHANIHSDPKPSQESREPHLKEPRKSKDIYRLNSKAARNELAQHYSHSSLKPPTEFFGTSLPSIIGPDVVREIMVEL
ncbi:hypothetical protein E1B28_005495 [Marasmius oreades]|uniref:Uncharacterized protein n=1 Tax=Marasmius oreades TaxID=181124 RepID=A0A9P7S3Y8_9AGAR|nr:uncharacterized protein E1B28_005495 [Marasmius oreades]KAG7094675.1 hypothetical protein E1B28_005495 [Marasmius oreades]